ncbi:nuclear transcription factor Y subunit B-4-like [Miscanthus floridulus]|uniref:nuclear transcription factor Y subunit B-4-like n=1 Tax=Miscanthus floridulus TaxID=154761 RepID=UPI00345ADA96
MSEAESGGGSGSGGGKDQDRFLPIANIGRIMRRSVPENGKIAKDAKESIQECVSEFISFITSEASDKCMKERRKTINGDDIIWSLGTLGFEEYVEPLKIYLKNYRERVTQRVRNLLIRMERNRFYSMVNLHHRLTTCRMEGGGSDWHSKHIRSSRAYAIVFLWQLRREMLQ